MQVHQSSQCKYHPDRAGVGICVRCRTVICTECTTRFDGINHCAACVTALKRQATRKPGGVPAAVTWLSIAGLGLLTALGAYGVLHMILLW